MHTIAVRSPSSSRRARPVRLPGVSIRPIEAHDADDLAAFYAALSDESRRRRFMGAMRGITPQQAQAFAAVDRVSEDGYVAVVHEAGPDDGRIVGHICLVPDGERTNEVAVAVADAFQGRGIGRELMSAAVRSARRRHLRALTLSLFAGNGAMRSLAMGAGLEARPLGTSCGVSAFRLEVGP